jgi:alginate O-acetyltransferase complex protein AlgI
MLFNSVSFLFVFLPIFLLGFFLLGSLGRRQTAVVWAVFCSLVFYAWNNDPKAVLLLVVSIAFNFIIGRRLAATGSGRALFFGVFGNLCLLSYLKYALLLGDTLGYLTGLPIPHITATLPVGVSFYTFTQIAFLVDSYRRETREYEPLKYGLFVTYFPHLVAGPIIHHREMMPQFDQPEIYSPQLDKIALGLSWFAAGLFKKVIFADGAAAFVDPVFKAAEAGGSIGFTDAWLGTASYALQIYFDFSGYSDMAIGLALLIGITFPLNFNSPYKADSLIEFWRRWHMTLSRFLRDYLYIPLGGNRKGPFRRYVNLLITMVLGGLWHGASWNFAFWGAIHGAGLVVNHFWQGFSKRFDVAIPRLLAWMVTLTVVLFAWVPFRANTFPASIALWKSMVGWNGIAGVAQLPIEQAAAWILVLAAVAIFAPNTQQLLSQDKFTREDWAVNWRPSPTWALAVGCVFGVAVAGMIGRPSMFLYFRF